MQSESDDFQLGCIV